MAIWAVLGKIIKTGAALKAFSEKAGSKKGEDVWKGTSAKEVLDVWKTKKDTGFYTHTEVKGTKKDTSKWNKL